MFDLTTVDVLLFCSVIAMYLVHWAINNPGKSLQSVHLVPLAGQDKLEVFIVKRP